jgi:hypothetical protein
MNAIPASTQTKAKLKVVARKYGTPALFFVVAAFSLKGSITAVQAYEQLQPLLKTVAAEQGDATESDLKYLRACDKDLSPKEPFMTKEWRDCTVAAVPKLTSEIGSFVATVKLAEWMQRNPLDKETFFVAHGAVDAGWKAFEKNQNLYKLQDNLVEAVNNIPAHAFIAAITNSVHTGQSVLESRRKQLIDAEMLLDNPDLLHKRAWLGR